MKTKGRAKTYGKEIKMHLKTLPMEAFLVCLEEIYQNVQVVVVDDDVADAVVLVVDVKALDVLKVVSC